MGVYNGVEAVVTAQKYDTDGTTLLAAPQIIGKRKKIEWNGSKDFTSESYQGEPGTANTPGSTAYEGSVTYHHDTADAGQALLGDSFKTHAKLQIVIMPVGSAAGKRTVTFDAYVTDDPNNLELDANVEKTTGLKIDGIPAEGTV